jgi:glycine betaine/proline transport system substrate-binding protein
MIGRRRKFASTIIGATVGALLIALAPSIGRADEVPSDGLPGKGITVQPIGTSSPQNVMQHYVIGLGLKRLGYTVNEYRSAEPPAFHLAIAQGDATFTAMFWDPLYREFYENAGGEDSLVILGRLIKGALQGYLIDKATADKYGIHNIEQLKDPKLASLFDTDGDGKANLAGCPPGWGCERVIEHHLDAYNLRDWVEHDQGSYFALIADVIARFKEGRPVLYYTWTPLWVSNELRPGKEVEWLEVPYFTSPDAQTDVGSTLPDGRNIGFAVNEERVVANREFVENNPAAAKLFELVEIPIEEVNAESMRIRQGEDKPEDFWRHAEDWVKRNQEQFDRWVAEALAAAKHD